jgi:ArsR family transcriptional regulator
MIAVAADRCLYYYRLMDLAETLKALSDPNRLRILNLLGRGTLCVCDLEDVLKLNQSNLSRHLAKLKQAGLVTAQKKGLFMYYTRKPLAAPYGPVVEDLYQSMADQKEWESDLEELRRQGCC